MKKDNNMGPQNNDILGRRLEEVMRPGMPSGFEERIMLNVRREAKRLKRINILLSVLVGAAGAVLLAGIVYGVFHLTGVDMGSAFSFVRDIFAGAGEGLKAIDSPTGYIIIFALFIGIFYLSLNGILNNRSKQKVLREEYKEYF